MTPGAPPGQVFMIAEFRQVEARTIDRHGTVKDRRSQKDFTRQVGTIWADGRWLLLGMAE